MKKVLVTGSAGFVGYHLCKRLLIDGWNVTGIDALTDYYDVNLKKERNELLLSEKNYIFHQIYLEEFKKLEKLILQVSPTVIFHLAGQAGVRHSLKEPRDFLSANIEGTFNLLEVVKGVNCNHLMIASSSSVYGGNARYPCREKDNTQNQLSFYAATKKSIEVISHSYSHIANIPTTCFRFFTVYGPWGRPDMALYKFTDAIFKDNPIQVFNYGKMVRDFTYVDDLIEALVRLISVKPNINKNIDKYSIDSLSSVAPWRVVNIGNSKPKNISEFISTIENRLGKKAIKKMVNMHPGDVEKTYADVSLLKELIGFEPKTSLEDGVDCFIKWYLEYNNSTSSRSF